MRRITQLQLVRTLLIFWLAFTAGYGALRLIKQDEWRWDHLAETYLGMIIALVIVWAMNRNKVAEAAQSSNDGVASVSSSEDLPRAS
jgi:hypothetical protein